MGNAFIDPKNPNKFREDNELSRFMKNFILNQYKFMNVNEDYGNKFYQKKACCLRNKDVPIGLPTYDPSTKKIVTTVLNLNVFNDQQFQDLKNTCNMNGASFAREFDPVSRVQISNPTCDAFYDKYCGAVWSTRSKVDTGEAQFYGPYDDIPPTEANPLRKGNQFKDCNCLNSSFMRLPNVKVDTTTIAQDPQVFAQTLDKRCYDPGFSSVVYIKNYVQNSGGCVNKITVDGILADTKYPALYKHNRKCAITPDDIQNITNELNSQRNALLKATEEFKQKKLELDKQIEDLAKEKNTAESVLTALKIQKEREKANLVLQFDKDLVALRTKNSSDTEALRKELEIAKQRSVDEISAIFQKREDDYKAKIRNIEDNMVLLKLNEEQRTVKVKAEMEQLREKSIKEITNKFDEREKDYRNKLVQVEKDTSLLQTNFDRRKEELVKELELAKQKSINEISAKFQQRETDYINQIKNIEKETELLKINEQRRTKEILSQMEAERQKSIDQITNKFDQREKDYLNKIKFIESESEAIKVDNARRTEILLKTLESQRAEMERKLKDLYSEREIYYKNIIDKLVNDNETKMKNLQIENQRKIDALNADYTARMAIVERQKIELNKQYDDFKVQTQKNMDELRKKYTEMEVMYEKQINALQKQLVDKNNQIKADLLALETKFNQDVKTLTQQTDTQKAQVLTQTNKEIEKYIEKYNQQKTSIDSDFENQKAQKKQEYESELKRQEQFYITQLDAIKNRNSNITNELGNISQGYKTAIEENQSNYNKLVKDYSIKKEELLKDFEKKKAEMEASFFKTMKELEDKKIETIKQKEKETNEQIESLNKSVVTIRKQVESESIIYRKELQDLINKLELDKISAIKKKQDETNGEINRLNQTVETTRKDVELKSGQYKQELQDLINKLEQDKISAIKKKQDETNNEINKLNQSVEFSRKDVELKSVQYKQELESLIARLENDKIRTVKIKQEETGTEIRALNKSIELIRNDFENKSAEYKRQLSVLINKLEEEKQALIAKKQEETQKEINGMASLVTKTRQEVESESSKYKQELKDLINKLEDEKIKKVTDYTKQINDKLEELNAKFKEEEKKILDQIEELRKRKVSQEGNKIVITENIVVKRDDTDFYKYTSMFVTTILVVSLVYIFVLKN